MNIGKFSADLSMMYSENRSYDQQDQLKERDLSQKLPTKDDLVLNKKKVKEVAAQINDFISPIHSNLKFEYHEDLNEYYVTVVNPETNEVIREIPPREMLDMYAAMVEFMGMLIDKRV